MPSVSALLREHPRDWMPEASGLADASNGRLAAAHDECLRTAEEDRRTDVWLACSAIADALAWRRLKHRRSVYDDRFRYEPWGTTFVGTCADAHRLTDVLPTLLGPIALKGGTLPGWRAFAGSRESLESQARDLLPEVLVHGRALLACGDGEGLRRVLALYRDDFAPLFAAWQGPTEVNTTEAVAASLGSTDLHSAHAIAASGALPAAWSRALASAGPPPVCPTTAAAIESILTAPTAAERMVGCACARRFDVGEPEAPSLAALRRQLATFDAWTGTDEIGPGPAVTMPTGAGPFVTGLVGGGMLLGGILRPSTTTSENHHVRESCGDRTVDEKQLPLEPSMRVLEPGPEPNTLRVLALVPKGLDYRSALVIWSASDDGTPDRRYCQRSSATDDTPVPGFEWCPGPPTIATLGVAAIGGDGTPSSDGPSTMIVLTNVQLPPEVARIGVSAIVYDGGVLHGDAREVEVVSRAAPPPT